MIDRSAYVTLKHRPATGLIPRGVTGRTYASGRTEWQISKGDLLQAHKMHIHSSRVYRELGDDSAVAAHLADAARVRRYLVQRRPLRSTLDLLRGKA